MAKFESRTINAEETVDNTYMLTSKQNIFIQEYLVDQNAAAAARRAGYSVKSADKIGHQLLENTRVSEQIKAELDKRMDKLEVSCENIVQEMAKIAFFKIADIFEVDENNELRLKDLKKMGINSACAIKSISIGKAGAVSVHFYDKVAALKLLGDYYKLWEGTDVRESKVDSNGETGLERIMRIIKERAQKEKEAAAKKSESAI